MRGTQAHQEHVEPDLPKGETIMLCMYQYCSKFCPSRSKPYIPVRDLTKEDTIFVWSNKTYL